MLQSSIFYWHGQIMIQNTCAVHFSFSSFHIYFQLQCFCEFVYLGGYIIKNNISFMVTVAYPWLILGREQKLPHSELDFIWFTRAGSLYATICVLFFFISPQYLGDIMAKNIFLVDTCNRCAIFSFFLEAKMVQYLSVEFWKQSLCLLVYVYYGQNNIPTPHLSQMSTYWIIVWMLQVGGVKFIIYPNDGNKNGWR